MRIPFADYVAAIALSAVLYGILWLSYPPIHQRTVSWHLAPPPPARNVG